MMNANLCFVIGLVFLSLAGCANLTPEEKCTAGGAAIGGVAGSVLSNQSGVGTVGGAVVGGVIGHEAGKKGGCR